MLDAHLRPVVGQAEEGAGEEHGGGVGGVEGEEVDSGDVGVGFADVGAEVELGKAVGSGNDGQAADLDAIHPEGDDADPGGAVVGVGGEAGREQAGDLRGGQRPVREEEIVPALGHGPAGLGQRPGAVADRGENLDCRLVRSQGPG